MQNYKIRSPLRKRYEKAGITVIGIDRYIPHNGCGMLGHEQYAIYSAGDHLSPGNNHRYPGTRVLALADTDRSDALGIFG